MADSVTRLCYKLSLYSLLPSLTLGLGFFCLLTLSQNLFSLQVDYGQCLGSFKNVAWQVQIKVLLLKSSFLVYLDSSVI